MSDERGTISVDWFYSRPSLQRLAPLDRTLWVLVLGAATADTVLTVVGLQLCFVEANPVAAWAIEQFGTLGLVLLKGGALLVLLSVVRRLPHHYALAALFGFSLPQVFATVSNAILLFSHAGSCFPA